MRDVIFIGGGPAGSTGSTLLKKYAPGMDVLVLEREKFPREHVGESQLPPISIVLDEMGCWDKVEAANFPIKIGATYRWGNTNDLWDFQFLPIERVEDEPRPAKYEGWRKLTAFQVERSVYDKILLDHSREMGVEVREETKVVEILKEGDRITGLKLEDGTIETARYYVDATGASGMLRRAMDVKTVEPSSLRNIAFWDYWNDTEWAFSIGKGGTRVQVMSLGYGWIWFIPISPTRTSIGLVCPAEYYRQTGLSKEEVYLKAVNEEPRIASLIKGATADGDIKGTKDWSYYAERTYGDNWFLVGEASGFADPILAAGLTMAHLGARELAYTIMALDQQEHSETWLKDQLQENMTRRVAQHIQFADFWYTANGCFTDVKEFTRTIAADAGLDFDANRAFQWLGTGGFMDDGNAGLSGYDLESVIDTIEFMTEGETQLDVFKYNRFLLNMDDAVEEDVAGYEDGKVVSRRRWRKGKSVLPQRGMYYVLVQILQHGGDVSFLVPNMIAAIKKHGARHTDKEAMSYGLCHLESLLKSGWVRGVMVPGQPPLRFEMPKHQRAMRKNTDTFLEFTEA
jgi:flavin-dependent dehydrogenase